MDRRIYILVFLALAACQQKTSETVFPEVSNKPSGICQQQTLPTQFIVTWEDGRRTVETSENAELFKESFVEPNLDRIRHVEFDKVLTRTEAQTNAQISEVTVSGVPVASVEQWGIDRIEAAAVWTKGFQGQDVRVGVVDSMVDRDHPQLKTQMIKGYDFFNKADQWKIEPGNDHGTHVAGIIAADPTQGKLTGVAPKAKVIPANFMNQKGEGSLSDAVLAMDYVANEGARIINASWGGPCPSPTLEAAVRGLEGRGVLFVTASGNDGVDLDAVPSYPAAYTAATQITVAATYSSDFLTGWSNSSFKFVNLAAPGAQILSTVPGGLYRSLDGTSMATPFVAGAAALLLSAKPSATPAQVKQALLSSVDVKEYRVSSQGRLNVRKALETLNQLVP